MNTREVVIALPGSIDNVTQTVEESSAFARGKKLVGRRLFLKGCSDRRLLGSCSAGEEKSSVGGWAEGRC
jgi:hypothetical protein